MPLLPKYDPHHNMFVMRSKLFSWLILLFPFMASAQLYISPGARLQVNGNALISLQDMDLVNNGSFVAGNSIVYFSGAVNTTIAGTEPTVFYSIRVNKDGDRKLVLQRAVAVADEVYFAQGLIDLNGHNLELESNAVLTGESENSRVEGPAGGEIVISTTLDAPLRSNPGNLGAMISSDKNLGAVQIKRGHRLQSMNGGTSIRRYYNIIPGNNAGLDATLRLYYFESELEGLAENDLSLWRSEDVASWEYSGYSGRDVSENYVENGGIEAFSTWTLAATPAQLPVLYTMFNLQCENDRIVLRWTTGQENNSSHFIIEKMYGNTWSAIGRLPAAGYSNTEKNYLYTDVGAIGKSYYRLAQYDLDGSVHYSPVTSADCNTTDALIAWPNPFSRSFSLRIKSAAGSVAYVSILDAKGAMIQHRQVNIQAGLNQLDIDLQRAASGIYMVRVQWAEGTAIKTIQLLKQ